MSMVFLVTCKFFAFLKYLKGKFPQTTTWIGWVESNLTNPIVKVWADLDNPFKRGDYAKLCMSPPSLDGTLPEYIISQEDNSPLTLYIDCKKKKKNFYWISIVLLIKFIHKLCMHIHLSPNLHIREDTFSWKVKFCKILCTVPLDSCTVVTSHIRRVPTERVTYTKLMKTLKNHTCMYLLIGLSKFAQTFAFRFLKSSSIHPICINAWGSFSFNGAVQV